MLNNCYILIYDLGDSYFSLCDDKSMLMGSCTCSNTSGFCLLSFDYVVFSVLMVPFLFL